MANLKPTNEEFSDSSYNNDSRLSQPSSGVRQVRSVQADKGYNPDKRRGDPKDKSNRTWNASMQAGQKDVQPKAAPASGIRSVTTAEYQNANQAPGLRAPTRSSAGGMKVKRLKSKIASKLIGRTVTLSIWSWAFFIWLWVQVPFTILSIAFLAITGAVYEASNLLTLGPEDGAVVSALKSFGDIALTVVANSPLVIAVEYFVKTVFSLDLNALNPAYFFMLFHLLVIFVGWGVLFVISLIYTMTGQKAFSGTGAAGKNAMFILAFVGYTIPILNIFPLFFLWTLMVLKNPK